ncbi:MAG: acyl carrier protein [Bacteroidota bacterium]
MTQVILQYIQNNLLEEDDIELTADEDLLSSGLLDSMAMMRLIGFIEERFETKIPPEDLVIEHFITVSEMEKYLQGAGVKD